jgi:hypothetical protein
VFVAYGFGLGKGPNGRVRAGRSNLEIAKWIIDHNPGKKPVITQKGVYLAFSELAQDVPDLKTWEIIPLPDDPKVYVDTYGATLQAWAVMNLKGFRHPVPVSHDLQLQRTIWNFERINFKNRIIIPEIAGIGYERNSIQHWGTRSRGNWLIWELFFARPINYILGRI